MIQSNKEYFEPPYYFYLKEYNDKYTLYFSVANTLTEARKKDDIISFVKDKEEEVKLHVKNILKSKKKKTTDEVKNELEELVNSDGGIMAAKTPFLNQVLHPHNTLDQTIAAARITNNPLTRGYRTYFGEGELGENDMSGAYFYQETKDLDGKETFKYFVEKGDMEPEEAKERTKQQGKDPSGKRDKKSKYRKDKNFVSRQILPEIQKAKMIKMLEDLLVNKKKGDNEINEKEPTVSKIIDKNVRALKKQAEKQGISITQLIKMLKSGE
jgi:hypothetical protein